MFRNITLWARYYLSRLFADPRSYSEGPWTWVPAGRTLRVGPAETYTDLVSAFVAARSLVQGGGGGVVIELATGTAHTVSGQLEHFHGTVQTPILVRGPAEIHGDLSLFDCSFVYLVNLTITAIGSGGAEALHLDSCSDILIRSCRIDGGARPPLDGNNGQKEGLKANQCDRIYVEFCDIFGAWDNAVDFVAVRGGHVLANRIHLSGDWAIYAKGGSYNLRVEANEIFDATHGFSAGQGTGTEWLSPPYVHYEAYGIRVFNNVIHDTPGHGLGVQGGYNVALAYNTLYRVGYGTFGGGGSEGYLIGFGNHSFDTASDDLDYAANHDRAMQIVAPPAAQPPAAQGAGGWGTACHGNQFRMPIPNFNVLIYNNLLVNPDSDVARDGQFKVYSGPEWAAAACSDQAAPDGGSGDEGLVIEGNLIWNGTRWVMQNGEMVAARPGIMVVPLFEDLPMGQKGCQGGGTCTERLVDGSNAVNQGTTAPALADPAGGNFRPVTGGNLFTEPAWTDPSRAPRPVPAFTWPTPPMMLPHIPTGPTHPEYAGTMYAPSPVTLTNEVIYDRYGARRQANDPPGAHTDRQRWRFLQLLSRP